MKINYLRTFWGCEQQSARTFLRDSVEQGYQGVEINFPDNAAFIEEFKTELSEIRSKFPSFKFVAQQVLGNKSETVSEYKERMSERLHFLLDLTPDAVNSHTGKDFFEFEENVEVIAAAELLSKQKGIPLWHEIHRGRFSFHLKSLLPFLKAFPDLKLVADLSHFCVVSESDLSDQQGLLRQIYPHVAHIHARVGFEQSPQVNHPFAPEWKAHLDRFVSWWTEIIKLQSQLGNAELTITPEFGPFPYMPQIPFSMEPTADQLEINLQLKKYLQQKWKDDERA
ncbi:MAG: sugar phosphate isomerase/epimerase family protein [Crocinitomicaceae bacterium]